MSSQPALNALNFFMADVRDGLGPFLGVYLQSREWSPSEIGLVMTLGALAGMIATAPLGALVDRVHAKRTVIAISGLAIVASSLVILFWPGFLQTAIAQSIGGVGGAAIGPAIAGLTLVWSDSVAIRIRSDGMRPSIMPATSRRRCWPASADMPSESAPCLW